MRAPALAGLARLRLSNDQTPRRVPSSTSQTESAHLSLVCDNGAGQSCIKGCLPHSAPPAFALGSIYAHHPRFIVYDVQRRIPLPGRRLSISPHYLTGLPAKACPMPLLQQSLTILFVLCTDTRGSCMLHQRALQTAMAPAQAFWLSILDQHGATQMLTPCSVTMSLKSPSKSGRVRLVLVFAP